MLNYNELNFIKHIAYLGDTSNFHCDNIKNLFKNYSLPLKCLDLKFFKQNQQQMNNKVVRFIADSFEKLFGFGTKEVRELISKEIVNDNVQCILAYWGTNPLPAIRLIKSIRPEVKIILNVLCHPIGLTDARVFIQNKYMSQNLKYVDGLVFPGEGMKVYFQRFISKHLDLPSLVLPPYFSKEYSPKKIVDFCSDIPSVLFLGRMDWWDGQPTDNVHGIITELITEGVHIYHSDKTGKLKKHEKRHIFKPMAIEQLCDYATQFDASLIVYNLDKCKNRDRFVLTIPDRLLASVAFGLPIAMPAKSYDACRVFLKDYEAVIEFSSPRELIFKLKDRDYITHMKNLARANSKKYIYENYFPKLINFWKIVMDRNCAQK